jgi:general L-amino acid transport system substrate-binding protein
MHIKLRANVVGLLLVLSALSQSALAAEPTLGAVKTRGELSCGVNGQLPGFSLLNAVKAWEGIDVDLCRAIAAAVLGDAQKVKFTPLEPIQRFDALRSGVIDVLASNSTLTLQREANGLQFAIPNYYDGQGFVVAKKLNLKSVSNLLDKQVCVIKGTTHQTNMEGWFKARHLSVVPVVFDSQDEMYDAFLAGRCVAATQDISAMATSLVRRGRASEYMVLPEIISKEPLGPYVRRGDDAWLDVVRWTMFAMLEAEELGIAKGDSAPTEAKDPNVRRITRQVSDQHSNVDNQLGSSDPRVQLLLGVVPGNGKALGLDEAWAANIIRQVGNYSEVYERNLGGQSALKFPRGLNALWTQGGIMYPLPLR